VLELDCEGAEVEILRELTIQPRVILVETHGLYGAPTHLVASLLEKRGYIISDRGVAEPRAAHHCTEHDLRVLLGIKPHAEREAARPLRRTRYHRQRLILLRRRDGC
jgi:hypothetical protein